MRLLLILCVLFLSLPSSTNAIRMHRIQRQQQKDSSALTTETEAGFSSTVGTLSAYNGHVYTTTATSAIKHITLASATTASVQGPSLIQISHDGESSTPSLCGITSTGILYCTKGKLTDSPQWIKLTGSFQQVVIRNSKIIALQKDGSIVYGKYDASVGSNVIFTVMTGSLTQISYDGRTICGMTRFYELMCHDSGLMASPKWRKIPISGLDSITIEGVDMIGHRSADDTLMIGTYQPGMTSINWKLIKGKYEQISCDPKGNKIWAIDATGVLANRVALNQGSSATLTAPWVVYKN